MDSVNMYIILFGFYLIDLYQLIYKCTIQLATCYIILVKIYFFYHLISFSNFGGPCAYDSM